MLVKPQADQPYCVGFWGSKVIIGNTWSIDTEFKRQRVP